MKAFRPFKTLSLALIAALVLGQAPALLAAPTTRIEGRIFATDLTTPAAGLDVAVTAEGAKAPAATTRTDKDGKFRLEGIPAGNYLVVLAQGGNPVAAASVTAAAGKRAQLTLALPPVKNAPAQSGSGGFFTTTWGAVTTVVVGAVVLAVAADAVVENDGDAPEPVSPSSPN